MQALPVVVVNKLMARSLYPLLVIAAPFFFPLMIFSLLTGAIYPEQNIEPWGENPLEITGAILMLSIMPSYLAMCFLVVNRANNATFKMLAGKISEEIVSSMRYRYTKFWPLSVVLFLAFGFVYNIGWTGIRLEYGDPLFYISIATLMGHLALWITVGITIFIAIHEGLAFHKLGKLVPIDLYNLDELNGFGRASLNSFLMVVGALAITTVQSIDQVFRLGNYINALIVTVPTVCVLVPLPVWSLHRRIKLEKSKLVSAVSEKISEAPRELQGDDLHALNALMQRREDVQKLRSWPMDLTIVSRFALYIFIPPLAWTGAALMEVFLDSYLIG